MSLWAVLLTGLLAGGASCAAVQGGLLAGTVARRRPEPGPKARPVASFLAGKLVSHTLVGALLGLLGDAVQVGFRTRAALQVAVGVVMVALAADLLGFGLARRLAPRAPQAWSRLVRRSARWGGAAGPALLGVATVLIPCGATLSIELLAVASGSPLAGAAIMATFVVGTSPLFAAIGYVARRSTAVLKGRLGALAGVAVLVAGLVSLNAGLTLLGSPVTLSSAWRGILGGGSTGGPSAAAPAPAEPALAADGVQRLVIDARSAGYSPSRVSARAGVPTEVVMRTNANQGCTRAVVFPTLRIQRVLPATGETVIDLGRLSQGTLRYTCAMGMYSGSIQAS